MKRKYKLIKMKPETAQDLMGLMTKMGISSLDDLVNTMIRVTDEYHFVLKGGSWRKPSKGATGER